MDLRARAEVTTLATMFDFARDYLGLLKAALIASGLALPARRITINLAPADLPKEGSHYDLPIALGLMAAIGAIPPDALAGFTVLGELGLDGSIAPVAGVLHSAIQITTAGSICAVLDMLADGSLRAEGFVRQEEIALDAFLANRFGHYYAQENRGAHAA